MLDVSDTAVNIRMPADTGSFVFTGEAMTPVTSYTLQAAAGALVLAGADVTLSGLTHMRGGGDASCVRFRGRGAGQELCSGGCGQQRHGRRSRHNRTQTACVHAARFHFPDYCRWLTFGSIAYFPVPAKRRYAVLDPPRCGAHNSVPDQRFKCDRHIQSGHGISGERNFRSRWKRTASPMWTYMMYAIATGDVAGGGVTLSITMDDSG